MGNCFTKMSKVTDRRPARASSVNGFGKKNKTIDRRSARSSFFDAKRREKEVMAYTESQFRKTSKARPATPIKRKSFGRTT